MSHERTQTIPPPEWPEDLEDQVVIERILENGIPTELEALRKYNEIRLARPISSSYIETISKLAQQRRRLIQESSREYRVREASNPKATALEYAIGMYREGLERPVRDAVFILREKGYSSYESGFRGFEWQSIGFNIPPPELATFAFSEKTEKFLKEIGAEPFIESDRIGFRMLRLMSDDELALAWDTMAADLPSLKDPQPLTDGYGWVTRFRKKQDAL